MDPELAAWTMKGVTFAGVCAAAAGIPLPRLPTRRRLESLLLGVLGVILLYVNPKIGIGASGLVTDAAYATLATVWLARSLRDWRRTAARPEPAAAAISGEAPRLPTASAPPSAASAPALGAAAVRGAAGAPPTLSPPLPGGAAPTPPGLAALTVGPPPREELPELYRRFDASVQNILRLQQEEE